MIKCGDHIPLHLHQNGRKPINSFVVGERLFWRTPGRDFGTSPFSQISLAEISMNRSGTPDTIFFSEKNDVLIIISKTEENNSNTYDCSVLELLLSKECFFSPGEVRKVFGGQYLDASDNIIKDIHIECRLIHDPMECNYSHSMFRFTIDGEIVYFTTYQDTLGNKVKPKNKEKELKKLRAEIRLYLSSFVVWN